MRIDIFLSKASGLSAEMLHNKQMNGLWNWIEDHGYFPETVNERAARLVALFVAILSLGAIIGGAGWISLVLFVGFGLRAAWGPRWDPVARAALLVAPLFFAEKEVPGPPKRFAQIMGTLLSGVATLLFLLGGAWDVALLVLCLFASAESLAGFCVGCRIFSWMMMRGWIPEDVCRRCIQ